MALALLGAVLVAYVLRHGDRASTPSSAGVGPGKAGITAVKETEVRNEATAKNGAPEVPGDKVQRIAPESRIVPSVKDETGSLMERYRGQPNAILRREALKKWAEEDQPGVPEVAELALQDTDPTVILRALDIIGSRGQRSSMAVLVKAFQDNARRPDGYGPPICEAAARALGHCGDSSVVSLLVKELERHADLSYDTTMVESLGMIGDHSALDALDRHISRLEAAKPTEPMFLEPWRHALAAAVEARDKIRAGGVQ